MERRRIIIFGFVYMLVCIFMGACGIGTETGNPEEVPFVASMQTETDNYKNETSGIELSYRTGWTHANPYEGQPDTAYPDLGSDQTLFDVVKFSGGTSGQKSTVTIYIYELKSAPISLAGYLEETEPSIEFEEYKNSYLSGYVYNDPSAGIDGEKIKEIYFLKNTKLLYIVAELFEGSGSQEAEIILSTIRFTE